MPYIRHALSKRLTRRTCLSCGHQGRELQGAAAVLASQCPKCGADLYARPPRSYAEMEGLVEVGPDPSSGAWRHPAISIHAVAQPRLRTPRLPQLPRLHPATAAALFLASTIGCAAALFLLF